MKKLLVLFMVTGLVIAGQCSVLAYTTYELSAVIKPPYSTYYSSFSLLYNDFDEDNKFSFNELVSFSGVMRLTPEELFPMLIGVPMNYLDSPYTDGGGTAGYGNKEAWDFGTEDWRDVVRPNPGDWTYSQEVAAPAVPVSPSVWLLASGILGLAGLRRRFSK